MSTPQAKLIRLFAGQANEQDGQFICNFNTSQLNNVSGISLKTCTFRNNHPNVFGVGESSSNGTFTYTVGATTHTTDVATGFYTLTELLALINPDLQTNVVAQNAGATAVLSLDAASGKVILTVTGTIVADLVLIGAATNLNGYLGNKETITVSAAGTDLFRDFPELGGLKFATVSVTTKSPQTILNAAANQEKHTNSIGAIPVTVPYLAMQAFTDPSPADSLLTFNPPEHLREVRFTLRDSFGRRVKSQGLSLGIEMLVWTSS